MNEEIIPNTKKIHAIKNFRIIKFMPSKFFVHYLKISIDDSSSLFVSILNKLNISINSLKKEIDNYFISLNYMTFIMFGKFMFFFDWNIIIKIFHFIVLK